jgi:hypothetical protein
MAAKNTAAAQQPQSTWSPYAREAEFFQIEDFVFFHSRPPKPYGLHSSGIPPLRIVRAKMGHPASAGSRSSVLEKELRSLVDNWLLNGFR